MSALNTALNSRKTRKAAAVPVTTPDAAHLMVVADPAKPETLPPQRRTGKETVKNFNMPGVRELRPGELGTKTMDIPDEYSDEAYRELLERCRNGCDYMLANHGTPAGDVQVGFLSELLDATNAFTILHMASRHIYETKAS